MPIFEYECTECGEVYEVWGKPIDYLEPCPICGGQCKIIISPSTFRLKGEGWGKDGYSKPKKCKEIL